MRQRLLGRPRRRAEGAFDFLKVGAGLLRLGLDLLDVGLVRGALHEHQFFVAVDDVAEPLERLRVDSGHSAGSQFSSAVPVARLQSSIPR